MREYLVTDMVNISKIATNHKISAKQSQQYFINSDMVLVNPISTIDKLNQEFINSTPESISSLVSITSRKNRKRILGFTNRDGSDKYKG